MTAIHTVTSREFGHNVSSAKNLAKEGPLFITDRGEPAFVLINIEEYRRLSGQSLGGKNMLQLLQQTDEGADFDFDFEPVRLEARDLEG